MVTSDIPALKSLRRLHDAVRMCVLIVYNSLEG